MKKLLTITILCLFTCLLLFGYFQGLQASGADSAELEKAWKDSEAAIKTANDKMAEIRIAYTKYKTERDTLRGDAPSSVLGLIGKGFSHVIGLFFSSAKGVRIIELNGLIMYTWVQTDILNMELSTRDAARNTALAAYNASGSHNAEKRYEPDYETVPIVSVPCPNMCGVDFTSTDSGGLRNLKDYLESAHRESCGGSSANPPGCGVEYWTCDGRNRSGTERHKPRTCDKLYKWNYYFNGKVYSKKCGIGFRNCTNPAYLHNQYLSGTYLEFSTKHADKDDDDDSTASTPDPTPTPSTPDPTPSMHVCGVHASTVSGDHSWGTFTCGDDTHTGYLCQQPSTHGAASCGTSGHYACDGSDHSYMSCPVDSNGNSCSYGSYYACSPHTHAYPSDDGNSNMVTCDVCYEEYDPALDGSSHSQHTWTCGACGKSYISCANESCSSSSYGYHYSE